MDSNRSDREYANLNIFRTLLGRKRSKSKKSFDNSQVYFRLMRIIDIDGPEMFFFKMGSKRMPKLADLAVGKRGIQVKATCKEKIGIGYVF